MKKHLTLLAAVLLLITSQFQAQNSVAANRVLRKVAHKLARVKTLGYKYTFHLSHPSQERSIVDNSGAFVELQPSDGATRFRFQFVGPEMITIYNGAEQFFLEKKSKKLHLQNNPIFKSFGSISLQNSPLALKYALPTIIADSTIAKKVSTIRSGPRELYVVELSLPERVINAAGEIVELRADQITLLKIKVDMRTLLPVEVVQTNNKNDETLTTTYAEITETPKRPAPESWYYSTFLDEYALQKQVDLTLIKAGLAAPDFNLVRFGSGSRVGSEQFRGKLVLMEFWIAQCGFCISAVPRLNELYEKYRGSELEIVSINMYDPAATIDAFGKKYKPKFPILTGGESIAAPYGIDAYPAVVLVSRSGMVVYASSGLDQGELDTAIAANLKE